MPRVRRSDLDGGPEAGLGGHDPRRLLDRSPSFRITVITAPAGSGKSRLVSEWLRSADPGPELSGSVPSQSVHPSDGCRADWLRIDVGPEDRAPAETPGRAVAVPPAVQQVVDDAIGWLSATARVRPRLALSGLELLTPEQVSHLVGQLIAELPRRVQVVLVGTGSGLPASCLVRFSGELVELRTVDLWWSPADLVEQLARLTGTIATQAEADQLYRLTGGWPAGVILLGRMMRAGPAVLTVPDLAVVPEILDFVTTEVLDRLGEPMRGFVLRTSVLDELNVDDCAALVPELNPEALLIQVHRQALTGPHASPSAQPNPSPQPSPGERGRTPRYHRLIRAAALRQLRSADADAQRGLLRIAGAQARRRGREPAAVSYLAGSEDWDGVLAVLLDSAANGFRGWDPARLRAAVQRLPDQVWRHDAERRALVAFAAGMSGDQMFAAQVIQQTPAELRDGAGWWSVLARLIEALPGPATGALDAYRAACSALVELQTLERSIQIPPVLGVTDHPSLVGTAHLLAARAAVFDRDQAGVRRHLEAGWGEVGGRIPRHFVLAGLGADALTAAWGGQLAAAHRRAVRAQRLSVEAGLTEHPMLSLTRLAQVEVLRARGRSAQALAELAAAAPALRRSEPFVAAASGGRVHTAAAQILRSMLHLDLADSESARVELERLDADGDDDPPRNLRAARALAWARLHLMADDVSAAELVLATAPDTGVVVGARIAAALQRQAPTQAQELLRSWPFEDTLDNRIRRLLAVAAIAIALERRPEAVEQVDQALIAAEPDGHVRIFLDAPPRARALVSAVLQRSPAASTWRTDLADRLNQIRIQSSVGSAAPITRRERAVLEHLTTTMTHAQIAAQLFVSDNTLKSHCRNLYRKLGVNTRADAVRTARARGWLEPPAVLDLDSSPEGEVDLERNITLDPVVVEL